VRDWLSGLFQSTLSRLLAYALSGFFTAFLVLLFGGRLAEFLRSDIEANIGLLLLLVLFSCVGLAAGIERILASIRERREQAGGMQDERVEKTQKMLLETLAKVESQLPQNSYERAALRAELLSRVDQWEGAVIPYLGEEDKHRIRAMRDHIQNQSLKYAKEAGADWTKIVKDITAIARSNESR
jgi:hypothetical protein